MKTEQNIEKIKDYIYKYRYCEAITFLQDLIEGKEDEPEYYWHLGIAYLLNGQASLADELWMELLLEVDSQQFQLSLLKLLNILEFYLLEFSERYDITNFTKILASIYSIDENYKINISDNQIKLIEKIIFKLSVPGDNPIAYDLGFQINTKLQLVLVIQNMFNISETSDIVCFSLANLYFNDCEFEKALNEVQKAITKNRDNFEYITLKSFILYQLGKYEAAISIFLRLLKEDLNCTENIWLLLCDSYIKTNQHLLAEENLEIAINKFPNDLRLKRLNQSLLPIIYQDIEELIYYRRRFSRLLDELLKFTKTNHELVKKNGLQTLQISTNLYLGYQGENDIYLQKRYAEFTREVVKNNYPQYSQYQSDLKKGKQKIRIGYVSQRLHTMLGHVTGGWVKFHNRDLFEVYSYNLSPNPEHCIHNTFAEYSDNYQEMQLDIEKICQKIENDKIDILVYVDIGIDPIMSILGAMKLAPIQCVTWSHPITSGLETIDYFLSSDIMEPPNADQHYTEKLIRLPRLGIIFPEPEMPSLDLNRGDLGFSQEDVIYLSAQSLFKYLPQYDYIYPEIALKVPNAKFAFFELNNNQFGTETFIQRINKIFSSYGLLSDDHCIFLPRGSYGRFLRINQLADIGLDTFGWSGGITSLQGIACHLPIVTCPGDYMRGRQTYGMLKIMEISETVANNVSQYIEIAAKLGLNPDLRQSICDKIAANKIKLYNDVDCVQSLENFYLSIL